MLYYRRFVVFFLLSAVFLSNDHYANSLLVGPNVNMVSGTTWPDGDPYLRQQNEPSVAFSSRNKLHLLAGANDYRTVDIPGLPEGRETGDSWLSYFFSINGGLTWKSTLIPGYPQDTSSSEFRNFGYDAGADPVVRAGAHGLFYYSGIVFDRGEKSRSAIIVSRFIDLNNDEGGEPIRFIDTKRIDFDDTGDRFLDKSWIAVDVPREGAQTRTFQITQANGTNVSQTVSCGTVHVAYTALSGADSSLRTEIIYKRSFDCGETWSEALVISASDTLNQGADIAIDPLNGNVHVGWRRFSNIETFLGVPVAGCAGDKRWWKTHADDWPVNTIKLGGETYSFDQAMGLIDSEIQGDASHNLARHLVVAKLNLIVGGGVASKKFDPAEWTRTLGELIVQADNWLTENPVGSNPQKEVKDVGIDLKNDLVGNYLPTKDCIPTVKTGGSTGESDAILIANSQNQGSSFSAPIEVTEASIFDQGSTNFSFRTSAYPSLTVDAEHRVYITFAARGFATLRSDSTEGDSRIVLSTSTDSGFTWSDPYAIDENPVGPLLNPRPPGHQIKPSMLYAGGKLVVVYYDFRQDVSNIFERFIVDIPEPDRLRHTMDVRVASAEPADSPIFTDYSLIDPASNQPVKPSQPASRYPFLANYISSDNIQTIQLQYHVPNLPTHAGGTIPFVGDYIDIAAPYLVKDSDGTWRFATNAGEVDVFQAVWTDNRDIVPPPDGDWTRYVAPSVDGDTTGRISRFDGSLLANCSTSEDAALTGTRNQNIYTANLGNGLIAAAPGNNRPFGEIQRGFVVYVQNVSSIAKDFQLDLTQPLNGQASFDPTTLTESVQVSVPPYSGTVRTVFATSSNASDSITVNVFELGGNLMSQILLNGDPSAPAPSDLSLLEAETGNPAILNPAILNPAILNPAILNPAIMNPAIYNPAILNPAIYNPAILNPAILNPAILNPAIFNPAIMNPAILNPAIFNPAIFNPAIFNPAILNPAIMNPAIMNPAILNPAILNPAIYNPAILNPAIMNPAIMNPAILNTSLEVTFTVKNEGNSTTSYDLNMGLRSEEEGLDYTILVYQLNKTPIADGCILTEEAQQQLILRVDDPDLSSRNLFATSAGAGNASFYLEPGKEILVTFRVTPDPTVSNPGNPEQDFALDDFSLAVSSQTVDSENMPRELIIATGNTATQELTVNVSPQAVIENPPVITTTSLTNGVVDAAYLQQLVATGGAGPLSWGLAPSSNPLPDGLQLSASGEITGTLLQEGTFSFTVRVFDGYQVDEKTFELVVAAAISQLFFGSVSTGLQSCGLTVDGSAYCWGMNDFGQLGDGTNTNRISPVPVSGGLHFESIVTGHLHSCGITTNGAAYCWGYNVYGQIGDGTTTNREIPTQVSGGLIFKSLDVDGQHTCGLTIDGSAYCWGDNFNGQLGDGTNAHRMVPVLVQGTLTFENVDVGAVHNCGVTTDGDGYCWGFNGAGGLGDGTTTSSNIPIPVFGGLSFKLISAGIHHSCGILTTGSSYCWGKNDFGQLGDGANINRTEPVLVSGDLSFTSLDAGFRSTCAVTNTNLAYCWGLNNNGQLGDGTVAQRSVPVPVAGSLSFASVKTGQLHSCGVTNSGVAYCWGTNDKGELGDGTTLNSSTPVPVAAGLSFTSVSADGSHACGVTTAGTAYCWGWNGYGQLGDGTVINRRTTPVSVAGGLSFASVSTGFKHTCGVTTTGAAYCWGGNDIGQLGDGTGVNTTMPVLVAGGLSFQSLSAGRYHSCGVIAGTGAIYCWGLNDHGQLGDGTTTNRTTPVMVSGGLSFVSVTAGNGQTTGRSHTCGVTTAGAAYCWGSNGGGVLGIGDGTNTDRTSPAPVTGGLSFQSLSAGVVHTCGITTFNAAYCWGNNSRGQLGDSTTINRRTPALVSGGLSFESVSSGWFGTCGVTTTGVSYCWGDNFNGQLGDGTNTNSALPVPVSGGLNFQSVSAGPAYTCGLTSINAAYCWGFNQMGELGDGTTIIERTTPVPVAPTLEMPLPPAPVIDLETVSAGANHSCGLSTDGMAYCWGVGGNGQLGNGAADTRTTPVLVTGGLTFKSIVAGIAHTCGVTIADTVYCWGANASGQLGDDTTIDKATPTLVLGGLNFQSVNTHWFHSCGLTTTGTAYCWGLNNTGQLGDGTTTNRATPVAVTGGMNLQSINPANNHTCALAADGAAYCWGLNARGQLGDGTITASSTPVPVSGGLHFTHLDSGSIHTCAVTTGGAAYCWGANGNGQLGDGLSSDSNAPVLVSGGLSFQSVSAGGVHTCGLNTAGPAYCWGFNGNGHLGDGTTNSRSTPGLVSGGLSFQSLSAGVVGHTCGVTTDGFSYCWGKNNFGQLGDGMTIDRTTPAPVVGKLKFASVSADGTHNCGLTDNGSVYCWGFNANGRLGDGTTDYRKTPVPVVGGITFQSVSTGFKNSCGIKTTGAIFCWGGNDVGQLGNGTTDDSLVPISISSLQAFSQVSVGGDHACAVTVSGDAYCWGANDLGQVGDGTTSNQLNPVLVSGGLSFTDISAGIGHTCGLTTTQDAYCWGRNLSGQLGDGSTTSSSNPVLVSSGLSFLDISAGISHSCGTSTSDTVYCWGGNDKGQLGDGTNLSRTTPTLVSGGLSFKSVKTFLMHTCAVMLTNEAFCWGWNNNGQLGDGTIIDRNAPVSVSGGLNISTINAGQIHTCAVSTSGFTYCWGYNGLGLLGDGTDINRTSPVSIAGGL